MLGQKAELHVVTGAQLAGVEFDPTGKGLDQGRLAGPVWPDERHVLAALEPQLGPVEQ